MNFTSLQFIPFLFIAFSLFYLVKGKSRLLVLLVFNILFIYSFSKLSLFVILCFTLFSYIIARFVKNKNVLYFSISLIVLVFLIFRYMYLFSESILVPVGLSFYCFKIISYLCDIYKGEINVENDILIYFNYIMFFPTILSGPITRFKMFVSSLNLNKFNYKTSRDGAFLLACGLFEKIVVADYFSIVVNNIYSNNDLKGSYLFLAMILYALQIYVDFDSYSNIAIGCSRIFSIDCGVNFKTPYISSSIKEFWNKWHISLSMWFKDYVYIPLGGNKKGNINVNILIVFILSGLWHGTTLNFLIWGIGNGIVLILENYYLKFYSKIKINKFIKYFNRILGIGVNFLVVSFLFIFFKISEFSKSFDVIRRMFLSSKFDYINIGLNQREWNWLLILIFAVFISDLIRSKTSLSKLILKRNIFIRWFVYISMIIIVIVFGVYGLKYNPSDFIYNHF